LETDLGASAGPGRTRREPAHSCSSRANCCAGWRRCCRHRTRILWDTTG